jgi:hypothetical protein
MIKSNLLIDLSKDYYEGGYCDVASIVGHKHIVFKQFSSKKKANEVLKYQKILARHDLAPKIYSDLCRLNFADLNGWKPDNASDWGYITEKASPIKQNKQSMILLQNLVEAISIKTKLKFWDCHWYNVGFVKRNKAKKLVCLDTGKESFDGYSNAWGNPDPGPKCSYCSKYMCKCEE